MANIVACRWPFYHFMFMLYTTTAISSCSPFSFCKFVKLACMQGLSVRTLWSFNNFNHWKVYTNRASGSSSYLVRSNLLKTILLNEWVVNNFTIVDILFYQLYYNNISLTGLKITQPLCLLLSFLHNRVPCMHNAWVADNLTLLGMLFLSIIV